MPKRTTTFELMLPPRDPGAPAYRWLYAALRAEILAGRLRPGARLPARAASPGNTACRGGRSSTPSSSSGRRAI